MAKARRIVIFDTSGLVSLLKADDLLYHQAEQIAQSIADEDWIALVPHEVFAETINVIGKKVDRKAAVYAGHTLIGAHLAQVIDLIPTSPALLERALDLQLDAKGGLSFVDCLVMAYADEYDTRHIFGFDATFTKNGYQLPSAGRPHERAA